MANIYKKQRIIKTFIIIFVLSLILFIGGGYFYFNHTFNKTAITNQDLKINIPQGTSISGSVDLLAQKGALRPAWLFKSLSAIASTKFGATIKAGYHKFPVGISNIDLFKALFSGEHLYYVRITFPEGIELKRFARIVSRNLSIDSAAFMSALSDRDLLRKRNINAPSIEGYLHPATYSFDLDISAEELIKQLLDAQDKIWEQRFARQAADLGKTRLEILTLASIIEAESPIIEERPRVAGVYWNRLAINMLLQADPTVQYAIGEKRRVLYADLKTDNRYNTYKYAGLPPGPINSPSISAIDAALNPEKHDYKFFVAVGDGSGRHNFAKTYNEHLRYVAEFRRKARGGRR